MISKIRSSVLLVDFAWILAMQSKLDSYFLQVFLLTSAWGAYFKCCFIFFWTEHQYKPCRLKFCTGNWLPFAKINRTEQIQPFLTSCILYKPISPKSAKRHIIPYVGQNLGDISESLPAKLSSKVQLTESRKIVPPPIIYLTIPSSFRLNFVTTPMV